MYIYQLTHYMILREILKRLLFEKIDLYNALPHIIIRAIGRVIENELERMQHEQVVFNFINIWKYN